MNLTHRVFAIAAIGLASFLTSAHADVLIGRVVAITDGDTVKILDVGNTQYTIRLAGIDAPEMKMPFGKRAKEALSNLVFDKVVRVETDKVDRYGRSVGKIIFDGRDANLAMIAFGLAWHYKKYASEQSQTDRLLYASTEDEARSKRIGIWTEQTPVAPWEWRSATKH